MVLFILCKLILQTRMGSHPVARCLIFGWTLRILPYFMCANSKGSGETAWMPRLAWAFAGRLCDKYHNLMNWLIWFRCIVYNNLAIWSKLMFSDVNKNTSTNQTFCYALKCVFWHIKKCFHALSISFKNMIFGPASIELYHAIYSQPWFYLTQSTRKLSDKSSKFWKSLTIFSVSQSVCLINFG